MTLSRIAKLALAGLFLSLPMTAYAQVIPGGAGSSWNFRQDFDTTNGLPAGGSSTTSGPGISVLDASIGGQGDAFDDAMIVWVNNQLYNPGGGAAEVGQFVTPNVVNIAGLNVQVRYYADTSTPTMRTWVLLSNPTASSIAVPVDFVTNMGSDGATQIINSSTGDAVFTTADRWLITDDANTAGGDPTNTHVLFGPGSVLDPPDAVSQTVFGSAGTEGVLGTFNLSLAPGETQSLMFFNQINTSSGNAQEFATFFNSNTNVLNSTLVTGMTPGDLALVRNWNFGIAPTAAPEPGTLALLGLGIAGFGIIARRRRASR